MTKKEHTNVYFCNIIDVRNDIFVLHVNQDGLQNGPWIKLLPGKKIPFILH